MTKGSTMQIRVSTPGSPSKSASRQRSTLTLIDISVIFWHSRALAVLFALIGVAGAVAAPDSIALLGEKQAALLAAKGQAQAILVRIGDIDYAKLATAIESLHDVWNTCDDIYSLNSASLRSFALSVSGNPLRSLGVAFIYPDAEYIVADSGTVAWIEFRYAAQAKTLMAVGPGESVAAIQAAYGKPDLWEDGAILYARRHVGGRDVSLSFRIQQDTVKSVALWLSR